MLRALSELSLVSGLLLFVLLPSLIAAGVPVIVRRIRPIERLRENNEFVAIMYPVVGLFYGVFLAFAIVIVWQRFTDAEGSSYREVGAISDLWRNAEGLAAADRDRLQARVKRYVTAVTEEEWPAMAGPRADLIHDVAYDGLWKGLHEAKPNTDLEKVFFDKALDQLNTLGESRRERLMFAESQMPRLLWGFLLFGAVVTVTFSFFLGTQSVWTHALACGALTSIVGFSLLLISSLQFPFAGAVSIDNSAYVDLLKLLSEIR